VAGAQEPPDVYEPVGFGEPDDDFTGFFLLMVPLAIAGAVIGLRRDWNEGTFFGRSRVDLTNSRDPDDRPDLPIPTALSERPKTPEARLAEVARLKERGVISQEEHDRLRADILEDLAEG
jgi:hypothetical protein